MFGDDITVFLEDGSLLWMHRNKNGNYKPVNVVILNSEYQPAERVYAEPDNKLNSLGTIEKIKQRFGEGVRIENGYVVPRESSEYDKEVKNLEKFAERLA